MSSSKSFIWGASQSCPCCETATLAFKLKSSVEEVPADKVNFTCISWTFVRYPALQSIIAGCVMVILCPFLQAQSDSCWENLCN